MLVRDLRDPVVASKADWLPGTTWIGFTPQGKGPRAKQQCESAIQKQMGTGYILERVTQSFEEPNPGYADDPQVVRDRTEHEQLKDRLIAIHRLRHTMRPLEDIIGKPQYDRLQDIWSSDSERRRWSVAFPIVETYEITGRPKARDVFPSHVFRRIYQTQSATLRALDDEARAAIADLHIEPQHAPNAWMVVEDELAIADSSDVPEDCLRNMKQDLASAPEGMTGERWGRFVRRAAWLANRFIQMRRKKCDHALRRLSV